MARVPEGFGLFGSLVVVPAITANAFTLWEEQAARLRVTPLHLLTPVLRVFLLHLAHLVIIFLEALPATAEQEVQMAHRETTEAPVVTLLAYMEGRVAISPTATEVFAATALPVVFTIVMRDAAVPEQFPMPVAEVEALATIREQARRVPSAGPVAAVLVDPADPERPTCLFPDLPAPRRTYGWQDLVAEGVAVYRVREMCGVEALGVAVEEIMGCPDRAVIWAAQLQPQQLTIASQ